MFVQNSSQVELPEEEGERIVKPIGRNRLLCKIYRAYFNHHNIVMLHGPGGEGKTLTAKFALKKICSRVAYISCSGCAEKDVKYFTDSVMATSSNSEPEIIGVVIDELDKLPTESLYPLGCFLEMFDDLGSFFVPISNRPWFIKDTYPELWRRIMDRGTLIFAQPFTNSERREIVKSIITRNSNKKTIGVLESNIDKIVALTEGFNYRNLENFLKELLKQSINTTKEIERVSKNISPVHTKHTMQIYINKLNNIKSN